MDNEVKEILMQLVDTTNKLVEGQKRTDEQLGKMDARLDKIEDDLAEIKEKCDIAYATADHNGEVLEKLVDQLTSRNIIDVNYYKTRQA